MAEKQKFYVVWKGRMPGIYPSWDECRKQIDGFESALYKSYKTNNEARAAFEKGPSALQSTQKKNNISPAGTFIVPSICVDAACSGNPGIMEYQGVETATRKRIFYAGPFPEGTNNIGEFLGIVHGLGYLKKYNLRVPLYTDSATAIAWVRKKKANTKIEPSQRNAGLLLLIKRAEAWLHENTWENPILKWETADWGEIPADFGRK